jgi:hypothetical protein
MYETILRKLPEFRLDPKRPPTFHGSIIAGPTSIHLQWAAEGSEVLQGAAESEPEARAESKTAQAPSASEAVASPARATVISGPPASVEGTWTVTIHGPTGPQETTLILTIVNGVLGGTQSALGQVETVREIDYDSRSGKLSWVNKISKPLPLKLQFSGVVEGNSMNGKIKASIMGSFPFTAIKR